MTIPSCLLTVAGELARIEAQKTPRSISSFVSGKVEVKLYAPRGTDPQQPHTRDEVYVVVSGRGRFVHGDKEDSFAPGDLLWVPAGVVHRFKDFTDDLALWVVFFGDP
jgi:mannose-6-phosphate isomerase-like protein (cupin superfamily)